MDISETLAPNSDQLDAIELLGGPRTFTIRDVTAGNAEQPVNVHLEGFPRPWRPGKSMRRVLAACWGTDASNYTGRRVTLYCDTEVVFGKDKVGGTRIKALSDITDVVRVPLLVSRGKSAVFVVQPLAAETPKQEMGKPIEERRAASLAAFAQLRVTPTQLEDRVGKPQTEWTVADLLDLANVYTSITKDGAPINQYFTAEADR